jgi:hypothetical protein
VSSNGSELQTLLHVIPIFLIIYSQQFGFPGGWCKGGSAFFFLPFFQFYNIAEVVIIPKIIKAHFV